MTEEVVEQKKPVKKKDDKRLNELLEHVERLEGTMIYIRDNWNGNRRIDRLKREELINEMVRLVRK